MVRHRGSTNSHASMIQERIAANAALNKDLTAKMDRILGVIQGYKGKIDTTMELMLDMQKSFREKIEALRQENSAIKVRLDDQKNNSERERSSMNSRE